MFKLFVKRGRTRLAMALGVLVLTTSTACTAAPQIPGAAANQPPRTSTIALTQTTTPAATPAYGYPNFNPATDSTWVPGTAHTLVITPDAVGGDQPPFPCYIGATSPVEKLCVLGDTEAKKTIALVGDSHADQWLGVLDKLAKLHHWRLISLVHNSCPFSLTPRPLEKSGYLTCTVAVRAALPVLRRYHPFVVLDSNLRIAYNGDMTAGTAGQAAMYRQLRGYGMHVIALGDTPNPPAQPMIRDCVTARDPSQCGIPVTTALRPNDPLRQAAKQAHVPYIDPTPVFCGPRWCPGVIGNVIVYRDNSHASNTYMLSMWPWITTHIYPVIRAAL